MQNIRRFRFLVWLFVFSYCGCGTSNDVANKQDELSFGESIEQAHFVANELHFNMQSGGEREFLSSVFEAFKGQMEGIAANAPASDLSEDEKSKLIDACQSLQRNFEHVLSGSEDYQQRFSKVDVELVQEIGVLESMKERWN